MGFTTTKKNDPMIAQRNTMLMSRASSVRTHSRLGHALAAPRSHAAISVRPRLVCRASDDDGDFESKIAALKLSKKKPEKRVSFEERKKEQKAKAAAIAAETTSGTMTTISEAAPSSGETAVNVALAATLVWLPLPAAALGRKLWVNYKITDKRVCVETDSPFKKESLNVGYSDIVRVDVVGRGVGLWGDAVITCRDGSKIEMRGLEKFLEVKKYIEERMPTQKQRESSEYYDPMAE